MSKKAIFNRPSRRKNFIKKSYPTLSKVILFSPLLFSILLSETASAENKNSKMKICTILQTKADVSFGETTNQSVLGPTGLDVNYRKYQLYKAISSKINEFIANSQDVTPSDAAASTAIHLSAKTLSTASTSFSKLKTFIPSLMTTVRDKVLEISNDASIPSDSQFGENIDLTFTTVSDENYDGTTKLNSCPLKRQSDSFQLEMDPRKISTLTKEEATLTKNNEINTLNGILSRSQIAALSAHVGSDSEGELLRMDLDIVVALPHNFNIDLVSGGLEGPLLQDSPEIRATNFVVNESVRRPVSYLHLKIKDMAFDLNVKGTEVTTLFQYPTITLTFTDQITVAKNHVDGNFTISSRPNSNGLLRIPTDSFGLTLGMDKVDIKFNQPDSNFPNLLFPQLSWAESNTLNLFYSKQSGLGPIIPFSKFSIFKDYRLTLNNISSAYFGLAKTNRKIVKQANTINNSILNLAAGMVESYVGDLNIGQYINAQKHNVEVLPSK